MNLSPAFHRVRYLQLCKRTGSFPRGQHTPTPSHRSSERRFTSFDRPGTLSESLNLLVTSGL
jgi:hypothetical protein